MCINYSSQILPYRTTVLGRPTWTPERYVILEGKTIEHAPLAYKKRHALFNTPNNRVICRVMQRGIVSGHNSYWRLQNVMADSCPLRALV